jgi:hypothetical protein
VRVVIDTNVVVSGVAYPDGLAGRIVRAWRQGAIQLVPSRHILAEIARVPPRLRPPLTSTDAGILDFLDLPVLAPRYPIVTPAEFCRRTGL